MRAVLLLALLLALALSQSVEEKCALHFDDCEACLSDAECGWCDDYCVGLESKLCETEISTTLDSCPSSEGPVDHDKRQSFGNCWGLGCTDCLQTTGCSFCQFVDDDLNPTSSSCLPDSQTAYCTNPTYTAPDSDGLLVGQCPVINPDQYGLTIWLYLSGQPTSVEVLILIASAMTEIAPVDVGSQNLVLVLYVDISNSNSQRSLHDGLSARDIPAGADTAVAVAGITPNADKYPQSEFDADLASLANCVINSAVPNVACIPGLTILDAGSRTGSTITTGGSGGGGDGVSGGALAGIIIACIIAGIIIAAIAAYIYHKRKQTSYPAPFRSPAASYRP